jgi:DNA-directed RNA polymerase specialized sigma24 family protein
MPAINIDEIARMVAAESPSLDFDDVYQEAMLKMLAYPPQSRTGAFRIAVSARNSLWRKERRHLHADINGRDFPEPSSERPPSTEGVYDKLKRLMPRETQWLLNYYSENTPKHPGADAKRAHDYRERVRLIWELLRGEP